MRATAYAIAVLGAACNTVLGVKSTRHLDASPVVDVPNELLCPAAYVLSEATGTAYRKTDNAPVTFLAAAAACAGDQPATNQVFTHLVVISSSQEMAFLIQTLGGDGHWIGMSNLTSTDYQWVTAEPAAIDPVYWATGEPNMVTIEQCVFIGQFNQYMDHFDTIDCANSHDYICECDGFANDPSRY
jgi:hypothetical protein